MKTLKKCIALALAATMSACVFAGCGDDSSDASSGAASGETASAAGGEEGFAMDSVTESVEFTLADEAKGGKVYFLNFKPECDEQWKALAAKFTEATGIETKVTTAAANQYAATRKAELAKNDAPTMFQVNGPLELEAWKDYCVDLSGTELYKQLKSEDFALKSDGEVKAVAYVIETYGIIYDKPLLEEYFAKDYAKAKSVDEINSFDKFAAVCDDIQAHKDDLKIKGAFTSAGMDASSDWRFKTHLANLPIYYEYKADGIGGTDAIKGTYLDNYRKIWDLYLRDSTCEPKNISAKKMDDSVTEFGNGDAIFFQNGTWAYDDIIKNDFTDDQLGMLPIYIGAEGEENQGLCTGSENYLCINSKASAADIAATKEFMRWVITTDTGRTALSKDMSFVTPFKSFDDEKFATSNALVKIANDYLAKGKKPVSWNFPTIPGEKWKDDLGVALKNYAVNGMTDAEWEKVKTAFVDGWKTEAAAMKIEGETAAETKDEA